jgi:tRNA-Thr(GGU) m(6)t(6)A37 methyltransferase TsaA
MKHTAANNIVMQLSAIGIIRTPYSTLDDCPRNIGQTEDKCQIIISDKYLAGLDGLHPGDDIQILYWLDQANFTELIQAPRKSGERKGVFALRTPNRPNPIGSAVVNIETIQGTVLTVRGLDCLNGTTLLDIKPAFKG